MKKCTKCNQDKTEKDFNFKDKKSGLQHNQCKDCTRLSVKNHYNNNRTYYLDKVHKRNAELRLEIFQYMKKYLLSHPCVDCGESDLEVLEFDHTDRDLKFGAVSALVRSRSSIDTIKDEISKCEVRCANCHRRKTAQQFNWLKTKMPL